MRIKLNVFFLIFLCLVFLAKAQTNDSIFTLNQDQYSENGKLRLPPITEWKFKKGNDPTWASKNYDDSQWEKMDSIQITNLWYDEHHSFEGWFRFQFQLDSGFQKMPRFIYSINGAATDFYIDGELEASFGAAENSRKAYGRNRYYPEFVSLHEGQTYTVAVHFVDRVGPISQYLNDRLIVLGTESFLGFGTRATAKSDTERRLDYMSDGRFYSGAILTVFLLILVIWFLNRRHKHLLYLAVLTLVFSFQMFLQVVAYENYPRSGVWLNEEYFFLRLLLGTFNGATIGVFLPWLLASLLAGKIPKWLRISGIIAFTVLAPIYILKQETKWVEYFPRVIVIGGALIGLYYLIRYRKNVIGARWVLVMGLVFYAIGMPILALFGNNLPLFLYYGTYYFIPLCFLIYVALWLRETQVSERKKALEVTKISRKNQKILQEQNETLEAKVLKRTSELRSSLENLKATQSQLIQSEKMASLGELTAGIAHEIQNPLNFVNNFSEVSKELLEEMQDEIENGDFEEVKAIMDDVIQNLEKINHHGKRADGIVKGMLQHSRSSTGTKEPTDINALADEYLRLAYHGLRAKDKSFNATLETDFDDSIGNINVLPQDMGRVILNLITNAFYACNERKQNAKDDTFKPIVSVSTKKNKNSIIIAVKDNGQGIPKDVVDKIFQPFFTTKPTGQGTGLGLSMSYDIVTKGHGGELKVETKEGEGTTFCINLPMTK